MPRFGQLRSQRKNVPDHVANLALYQCQPFVNGRIHPLGGKATLIYAVVWVEVFEHIRVVEESDEWPISLCWQTRVGLNSHVIP